MGSFDIWCGIMQQCGDGNADEFGAQEGKRLTRVWRGLTINHGAYNEAVSMDERCFSHSNCFRTEERPRLSEGMCRYARKYLAILLNTTIKGEGRYPGRWKERERRERERTGEGGGMGLEQASYGEEGNVTCI